MSPSLEVTLAEFDDRSSQLEEIMRDWCEENCTSFDDAVSGGQPKPTGSLSIWDDIPDIDSKEAIGCLVALEPTLGCELPAELVRPGGYSSVDDLVEDLLPKIRAMCAVETA